MRCPSGVGLRLSKHTDAIEFGCCTAAAHTIPLIVGHPGLDDELRTEIDSTDWQGGGERALSFIVFLMLHDVSLVRILTMGPNRTVSCKHPCRRKGSIGRDRENEKFHTR